jgi:hypothetical protein
VPNEKIEGETPMAARSGLLMLAPLALAACAQYGPEPRYAAADNVPPARVVGDPVTCVPLHQFSDTRVRNDYTIDFMRNGREGWRNTLPYRCPGLAVQNGFTYETSLSQLCSTDIIHVLETAGGLHRGAGCGLGKFVPIVLER